jgi:hypothetical protein
MPLLNQYLGLKPQAESYSPFGTRTRPFARSPVRPFAHSPIRPFAHSPIRPYIFAKTRQAQQNPKRGSGGGLYIALVRIDSGMNNKKARIRTSPASFIFSTVWGFDSASTTCGRRKRKELATLYAAYASLLTH